jgi:hypothetical protein
MIRPSKAHSATEQLEAGGGVNMNPMTAAEMNTLAEWLKANGHTAEEVLDCLSHIAGAK